MKRSINFIFILLLFLTGSVLIASCKHKPATVISTEKQLWTCSMHPEIIRDKPGTCPICGMDLVKKEDHATALSGLKLNDLLQPTNQFVVSPVTVTAITRSAPLLEVGALGRVSYDTRLTNTISARVSGRIDKLYVTYRYQHIKKGEPVLDIYSPEVLTAEQELLALLKNDRGNASLIQAARQKLLLLGMSERQLQHIIKAGQPSRTLTVYSSYSGHIHEAGGMPAASNQEQKMDVSLTMQELPVKEGLYVQKGQTIFQVFNTDQSWVLLNIFPEDQPLVKRGEAVRVTPETAPGKSFGGTIDFIEPFYRPESKSLMARVYFNNAVLQVPIGSQVRARIFAPTQEANWLPKEAVLSLGVDQVVFLKTEGGFRAHKVVTGLRYQDQIQIVSGLTKTDSVASNAQFLVDSDSFIKVNQ